MPGEAAEQTKQTQPGNQQGTSITSRRGKFIQVIKNDFIFLYKNRFILSRYIYLYRFKTTYRNVSILIDLYRFLSIYNDKSILLK